MRLNDPPSTLAAVLIVRVFARPGTPSISRWPPASRQVENPLEHLVLSGDHAPDLEERALEDLLRLLWLVRGLLLGSLGHASSFRDRVSSVKHVLAESRVRIPAVVWTSRLCRRELPRLARAGSSRRSPGGGICTHIPSCRFQEHETSAFLFELIGGTDGHRARAADGDERRRASPHRQARADARASGGHRRASDPGGDRPRVRVREPRRHARVRPRRAHGDAARDAERAPRQARRARRARSASSSSTRRSSCPAERGSSSRRA